MTSFLVTAPDGRKLKITGDTMPSEQELDDIFEKTGTKQSVMDDRDQKIYNVPVAFDGVDTTYAIDTQHKGVDKNDFFGKVQVFNESSPSGMMLKKISDVVRPAMMKFAQSGNKLGSIKRGIYDNAELWSSYAWDKMAKFEIDADKQAADMKHKSMIKANEKIRQLEAEGQKLSNEERLQIIKDTTDEDAGKITRDVLLGEYADTDNEDEAQQIRLDQERELVKELKRFKDVTHSYWTEKREQALPEAQMSDVDRAVEQLTNGLMQGGESVATMFVTGNPIAGAALMGAIYGDMKSSDLYNEAITQGKSIEEAEAIGFIGGTIEGGIEMASDVLAAGFAKIAPIRKITDGVIKQAVLRMAGKPLTQATVNATGKAVSKQLKSVAKEAGKAALTEGAEEFFQGTLGDWWSNITGLTDISFADSVSEGFLSFLLTLPVGGLMGGGGTALYNRMSRKINDNIKTVIKKYNPDVSEEQMQQVADGLQEIFFQEAAPQYMKEINNLVEKQMSPDVMPNNFKDMTAETVKMLKEKFGMSDEDIQKTVNVAVNAIDVRNQFAEAYNLFRDGLELAGRNEAKADGEARILAARAVALAREEGKNVKDILDRWGLRFQQMRFADFYRDHEGQLRNPKDLEMLSRDAFNDLKNFKEGKELKGQSLLAFIKSRGGLKDTGGELKAMDADKSYVGLINNTSGNSIDDMTQTLWDAGYFVGEERPTVNQLLDAISEELQGKKRYSMNQDVQASRMDEMKNLADELARIGVDIDRDSYGTVNRKMREAQEKAKNYRDAAEFYDLSEDQQERYAMMRDNGASHEQAMAAVQNGADDEIQFQMAGPKALTAALDKLDQAKHLEANGVDNEEIRQQTGWFKGVDGKWRFEISDKDATINRQVLEDIGSIENLRAERDQLLDDIEAFKKEREKNKDAYPDGYLDELISQRYDKIEKIDYDIDHGYVSSAKTTLGELLNHDKLYDAYPSLRYMPVTMRTSDDLSGGAYSRKDNTIYLDSRLSDDEIKSILMHEIQHVIQEKENFARGGNIQFAKDYKKIIEKKASAEFMDLLDKKMKEGLERELKEYNLDNEAIVEIIDAYSDYTKKFFDTDAENEEINKAEKKYYETLEKYNISSDILENAMNNLRDQGIWKEAENEVKSKNKLSDADAYEIYRAFFGEVEARNTQARMDLTEEERRGKTPESTQDIANADVLIVMPDGTAMAYGPKAVDYFADGENKIYDNVITDHQRKGLIEAAPEKFAGTTKDDFRKVLKMDENGVAKIKSPIEEIKIQEQHLDHLLNDNEPQRKTFLNYVVATIERPNLVVRIGNKNHYIKFFIDKSRIKPHLQIVKVASDGSFYVTNYRPTKKQVNDTIKEGQIVYNLSNVRDGDVSSSVTNSISQNGGNVKRPFQFQSAFAGSRVDYDQPSLEAIGSGEGNQAHGWGLYYALNKDVAEQYRQEFIRNYQSTEDYVNKQKNYYNRIKKFAQEQVKFLKENKNPDEIYYDNETVAQAIERLTDAQKLHAKRLQELEKINIEKPLGQVHEVDIPENPYLLDEQKPISEQSEFVQQALAKILSEHKELNPTNKSYEQILELGKTSGIIDGGDLYDEITTRLYNGSSKKTSQLLNKYGIKGITYDGKQDGRCFVIFNPDDVKVIQKFYQGDPMQRGQAAPKGAYANNIIYLFENADASTVIHEMAHFFLDDMRKYATSEKTKEQLKAIYDYLGATNGDLTYEQNEYFADSFEVYLMEGKAPNQLLAKVFARFKKWMRVIWSEVKRLNGIKLTDEMRKTFDDMLGGRSLDFAMQMGGQKMTEMSRSGYISPTIAQRAVDLLKEGKMSRADMDDILERLKTGELARSEVAAELKKFEESNVKHNEQLDPFDTVKYKEALLKDNVNKTKVMEKIERLMEWAKPKEVNGRTVGRFPDKKMNDFFIEVAKEMSLDKEEAKKRIAENKGIISAILQSAALPEMERSSILGMKISDTDRPELMNALALENRVLSVAAKNISLDNAVKLYNDLQDSYNLGRLTANVTGDLKKARKNRMIADALRTIVGIGKQAVTKERSEIRKRLNRLGSSMMGWSGLMDILSMNDQDSKTGESALSQMMDVFECEQAEANGIAADGEELSRLFEKRLGGPNNDTITVSKYINNELDKKSTIEWDNFKQTFTKDELIDIYMKAKDKETREIMIHDEIKGYNESFLNVVNQNLTAEDRAFGDALFEFYNENWKKINAFYEEKYGVTMPKNDFYSPRSITREGISVSTGDMMAYAASGFTKKRTAKVGATVDIQGAFKVWNNYAVKTNRWLAWSDKLVDINSVFGNVEVKDTIERLFGSAMNARIRSEVERMAGGDQNKFFNSPLITKIRSNYARSVLALKPALMIKQLTSFPAYWNEMSAKDFAEGLADFFAHPKEAMEILGNTTLMKTRGTDIIRDFAVISKMDVLKGKKGIKWSDAIMLNIRLGDRGAIYMGGWALYKSELKKNLAKGMKEEDAKAKALERFERVTDETQQSGRLSQQSFWQSNPALRMFTMFQSSQNQYLRKEIAAVRGVLTGRMDKTQAAKQLFIFHVLLPCLFQLASDGFDWDKDAQLRAAIIGSLNGVFILSKILEKLYDKVVLDKGAFNSRALGVREVVPFWGSMEDLVKEFEKLADGDVDLTDAADAFEAFSKTAKAGGELSGVPLKYPLDVIKNFGSYAEEGEYAKEIMLWLGWSPYALKDDDE